MKESITSEVEEILVRVRPSLGGANVKLKEVKGGVVFVQFQKAPTNSSCHVNRTQATEELVAEILEDDLRAVVPDFEKVVVVEEGVAL